MDPSPVVAALHVAKATRLPMQAKDVVVVEAGRGIVGDRYHGTRHRHVTVQSRESLDEAATVYGRAVPSELTRRNITISAGAVPRAPGTRIRIGEVVLEVVRVAAPCKLLDDTIGAGAQEALRRRAGTVFRVLAGGTIRVGDPVDLAVPGDGLSSPAPRPA
ncbi:MOSC domain-containing protein [Nocardioides daeguensis]|uniref:MOSC domain-containing protein n=1 Tax=Nocardioides daeguensis TaxID=908359 RepID=A0ABP6VY49_9ACTN|nr:MOSC domain-containing protein [Nocardioides daeguensis]MBV6726795.1 MOSC domain-containing protein [Nocardioides daeguensis]MCR1774453.1 MOSC domain-containing protein [Nocardioides daeguensis]